MSEHATAENRLKIEHLEKNLERHERNFEKYMEKMDEYTNTVTAVLKDVQHSHDRHDKSDESLKGIEVRLSAVEKIIVKWSIPALLLLTAVSSVVATITKKWVG